MSSVNVSGDAEVCMDDYQEILKSLVFRGLFGVPSLILGVWMLFVSNPMGCFFIIIAAVILAKPLARLVAEPSGSLFYPRERFSRPLPIYGIPASKRAQKLYQRGILILKADEDKETLARMYSAIRTRLNAKPSN